jgi:hypothetical protein
MQPEQEHSFSADFFPPTCFLKIYLFIYFGVILLIKDKAN